MQDLQFKRIIGLVGFIILAAISCWATAESLHLLLPSWPLAICWAVTVSLFFFASYGSKMITDSLNSDTYVENRTILLIGGILIVLVAWLFASMPTNTHTFFYRSVVEETTKQDLARTKGYLFQLRDNVKSQEDIKTRSEQLARETWAQYHALENEIDNITNPGFGDRARAILGRIANVLQIGSIPELSHRVALSPKEKKDLKTQYRKMISELLQQRQQELKANYSSAQESNFRPIASQAVKNIETMEGVLNNMTTSGEYDQNVITQSNVALQHGYDVLRTYADFVTFKGADRDRYVAEKTMTDPTRLLSVIDVWRDYINGVYDGRGFIFWIFLSILVDVTAFFFFNLAFKREN